MICPRKPSKTCLHACAHALALVLLTLTGGRAAAELPANTVVYGVVPTLFGSDHPLQAVTARLDELRALGVTVLWLLPIQPSDDPSHISYAVTDFTGIRRDFGRAEDLRTLVREAHARSMRVILDFVPNHTSARHPWFLDAKRRGRASEFYEYYARDAQGKATHYFDWEHLPNLDHARPRVREAITGAMLYWLREFDLDGFRMDAAWGVRQRTPQAWPVIRAALAAQKPGVILLAEGNAADDYYLTHGFDAAYDWTARPGEWAWEAAFLDLPHAGEKIAGALAAAPSRPGAALRFLNNNDTGRRFITRHGAARTRVAAALEFTVPGVPLVFTGDEVGAEYEPYEDPPPLSWRDPHGLREFYRRLAGLRASLPALTSHEIVPLKATGSAAACAYLRPAAGGGVVVVLNFGQAASLELAIPAASMKDLPTGALQDLLNGGAAAVGKVGDGSVWRVRMNAESAAVFGSGKSEPAKSEGKGMD